MSARHTRAALILGLLAIVFSAPMQLWADGKIVRPRNYKGSLEELAQEAIIIFNDGDGEKSATQDLILKIRVAGKVDNFAWIVPLRNPPKTQKADAKLFAELFAYVDARRVQRSSGKADSKSKGAALGNP